MAPTKPQEGQEGQAEFLVMSPDGEHTITAGDSQELPQQ